MPGRKTSVVVAHALFIPVHCNVLARPLEQSLGLKPWRWRHRRGAFEGDCASVYCDSMGLVAVELLTPSPPSHGQNC